MVKDTHERIETHDEIKSGSDRSFGIVFTVVFVIVALWPLTDGGPLRIWASVVAALILGIALVRPSLLAPFNRLWFQFGLLLSKIMNPIVMGLVFYLAVTPTALIMRLRGKDLLDRRLDPAARTYWIGRDPPGPKPETMKQQF